jgi:hypothetical protein
MSRADDGARPVLVGGDGQDSGITTHGITRASLLRPGQKLKCGGRWYLIKSVITTAEGIVVATSTEGLSFHHHRADMVPVRDILHAYSDDESETP